MTIRQRGGNKGTKRVDSNTDRERESTLKTERVREREREERQ